VVYKLGHRLVILYYMMYVRIKYDNAVYRGARTKSVSDSCMKVCVAREMVGLHSLRRAMDTHCIRHNRPTHYKLFNRSKSTTTSAGHVEYVKVELVRGENCCTTSCTTNAQRIHSKSSKQWSV